jgi:hypothetical protein
MLGELFGERIDEVREAVESGENVAVVSEPFGGRETVVDEAVPDPDGRVSVSSVTEAGVGLPDEGVCLVDGPRYLYTRRLDGFDPLESFAERVAASDAVFVTSWSAYAWDYASNAVDLGVLGDSVRVPSLDAVETARLLESEYDISGHEDDFEDITSDATPALYDRLPFGLGGFLEETSDNVFEKISAASGGNPGVARAVFERRCWDEGYEEPDLSYEDAFALRVILSKETVDRDVLRSVVEPRSLPTTLRNLSDAVLVESSADSVSLRPESLPRTVSALKRRRLVW